MSKRGLEARCPFWKDRHDRKSGQIYCEGIVKGCSMMLQFRPPKTAAEKASAHKKKYCAGSFIKCPLFKAVMEQYE